MFVLLVLQYGSCVWNESGIIQKRGAGRGLHEEKNLFWGIQIITNTNIINSHVICVQNCRKYFNPGQKITIERKTNTENTFIVNSCHK